MLRAQHLFVGYPGKEVIHDVSLSVSEGDWLMLIGPNGAGKSTLIKALSGWLPYHGQVTMVGKDLRAHSPQALARRVGVLSQSSHLHYGFTVYEAVRMGRYAHRRGLFSKTDVGGEEAIQKAIADAGLCGFERRGVLTLSGGERQRVYLAQVLCQDPGILMLDEPNNALDLKHQINMFTLVDAWRRQTGRCVISAVHDLSMAKKYGTHAALLVAGRLVAIGKTEDVLSRDNLFEAYQMDVEGWMADMLSLWHKRGTQA